MLYKRYFNFLNMYAQYNKLNKLMHMYSTNMFLFDKLKIHTHINIPHAGTQNKSILSPALFPIPFSPGS